MSFSFDRTFGWTVNHRFVVALFILIMSGISIVGYIGLDTVKRWFQPPSAASEIVEANESDVPAKPSVEPVSLSNSDAVIVVHSAADEFFSPQGARALRDVVEELESLDYVRSVLWMDQIPTLNIFGLQEPLFPARSRPSVDSRLRENERFRTR